MSEEKKDFFRKYEPVKQQCCKCAKDLGDDDLMVMNWSDTEQRLVYVPYCLKCHEEEQRLLGSAPRGW